jgi:hypothetical protein
MEELMLFMRGKERASRGGLLVHYDAKVKKILGQGGVTQAAAQWPGT